MSNIENNNNSLSSTDEEYMPSGTESSEPLEWSSNVSESDGGYECFADGDVVNETLGQAASVFELGQASVFSGQAAVLESQAKAIDMETIANVKTVQHNLNIRRKRAHVFFAKKKLQLQQARKQHIREQNKLDRMERDRQEERRANKIIRKRRREYRNTADLYLHDAKMQVLDAKYAHANVVRECAIEYANRRRRLELEYQAIIAQQRMDLEYQRHEIKMCQLELNQKIAELQSELCQKYGTELNDDIFEVE